MRKRSLLLVSGLVLALSCVVVGLIQRSTRSAKQVFSPSKELSVAFAGFANDPVWTPGGPAIAGNGKGLYALFAVTNISPRSIISFKTLSVERAGAGSWKVYGPEARAEQMGGDPWIGMEGRVWLPGFGNVCAVAWPAGLPRDSSWRLRLLVSREPPGPLISVNQRLKQRLGMELFPFTATGTMISPVGSLSGPGKLLSNEAFPH
jgi:hypothetical protein